MSYQRIRQRLAEGERFLLDGAVGTELQRRGVPMDPHAWCGAATLENDDVLVDIHLDYIRAGADVITTNTYASSRLMLSGAGLADRVGEINRRAVDAALAARERADAGRDLLIAGSLSHMVPFQPGSADYDPARRPSDQEIADAFGELAGLLREAGVDLILLEMMYRPDLARMARDAALETGLPTWYGLSARRLDDGRVVAYDRVAETPLDAVAGLADADGIDVAGVMHTGADLVGEALDELRRHFDGPLMVYPDSGYFEMPDWRFVDVIAPERFEAYARAWFESGVQVVGGCCGLTVAHVEAAARARETVAGGDA
ncbi:MAG: homocysteine S-methyltransferase family protein [Gammaproteobacteria bacterium]|nr:homocysteine S-methyltransferase family protein [Gammaproteobacteria bacterium]